MNKDFHIHVKNGVNDINILKEYINTCINKKIDEVLLLDHGNRISEKHKPVLYNKEIIKIFFKNIEELRKMYPNIKIYKGIEVDYSIDKKFKENEVKLMKLGFDYIIGSVHGYKNYSKEEYYKRNLNMLDEYPTNILGHLKLWDDYLLYEKNIEEIIKKCKQKNISVEINTSTRSMWKKEQYDFMMKLLKKYKNDITYGSDAHKIEEIAINYDELEKFKGEI